MNGSQVLNFMLPPLSSVCVSPFLSWVCLFLFWSFCLLWFSVFFGLFACSLFPLFVLLFCFCSVAPPFLLVGSVCLRLFLFPLC